MTIMKHERDYSSKDQMLVSYGDVFSAVNKVFGVTSNNTRMLVLIADRTWNGKVKPGM